MPEYELLGPLGGDKIRIRFQGPFEGRVVTWDACLVSLSRLARDRSVGDLRNFIEVGDAEGDIIPLTLGLNVVRFDAGTVLKAVIMIRQYRRLRRGRHEYGPVYSSTDAP